MRNFIGFLLVAKCVVNEYTLMTSRGYDNYAFTSRTIRPEEELSRRGYTMYDPCNAIDQNQLT